MPLPRPETTPPVTKMYFVILRFPPLSNLQCKNPTAGSSFGVFRFNRHSTVTLLARLRGRSTEHPFWTAI